MRKIFNFPVSFFMSFCFLNFAQAEKNIEIEKALFAGGCFWCVEADFDKLDGVLQTVSGYTGGILKNPSYEQVSSGKTSHREAVLIEFDPQIISYEKLLDYFWQHIDPTDNKGQFSDTGKQYRSAIFYYNEQQKKSALASKEELIKKKTFKKPIVTEILPATTFYPAEDYHQNYHKKKSLHYKFYRFMSGRDKFLKEKWKNIPKTNKNNFIMPSDEELRTKLTPLQYRVTRQNATEPAFENEYYDNKKEGIYVDIISGEVLFASVDKYDSGSGWPSFTKPVDEQNIVLKKDYKLIFPRAEVRSKKADSHLGHLFHDGPKEKGGRRYCINSAALRFIPKEDMQKEGYGKYSKLFGEK